MTRPLTTLLTPALSVATLLLFTGCESANLQLPDGYAWNFSNQPQNTDVKEPRGSYRWGFNQSRINESLATTARDRSRYDYSSVLPQPHGGFASAGTTSADPLYTALDPQPQPQASADNAAVFTIPTAAAPTRTTTPITTQGSLASPTSIRILTGESGTPYTPSTPAPSAAPAAGPRTHTIVKGDNYWDLAKQYYGSGVRFKDIEAANPGKDPKKLQLGDTLVIP